MKVKQLLIAIDQVFNTLIKLDGEWGYADETLSARAWRVQRAHPHLYKVIDTIFFWDSNHCMESYQMEMERKQLPSEYRK